MFRLILIAIGFLVACVFTVQSNGQERRQFDSRPYFAAAHARSAGTQIILQRMQGTCPNGLKRAVAWSTRIPVVWLGCWQEKAGKVEIGFEDGDFASIPREAFEWTKGDHDS